MHPAATPPLSPASKVSPIMVELIVGNADFVTPFIVRKAVLEAVSIVILMVALSVTDGEVTAKTIMLVWEQVVIRTLMAEPVVAA